MRGKRLEVGFYFGLFMVDACLWYGRLGFNRGSDRAAGFDDLLMIWTHRLFFSNVSVLLREVKNTVIISSSQSLTSARINDCTLRVPNKTTTLLLYEK